MVGSDEMSFEKWFLFRDTLVFWGLYEMPFLFNQFMASYDTTFSRIQQLEVSIGGGGGILPKKNACKYGVELHIKLRLFDFLYLDFFFPIHLMILMPFLSQIENTKMTRWRQGELVITPKFYPLPFFWLFGDSILLGLHLCVAHSNLSRCWITTP